MNWGITELRFGWSQVMCRTPPPCLTLTVISTQASQLLGLDELAKPTLQHEKPDAWQLAKRPAPLHCSYLSSLWQEGCTTTHGDCARFLCLNSNKLASTDLQSCLSTMWKYLHSQGIHTTMPYKLSQNSLLGWLGTMPGDHGGTTGEPR